MKTKVIQSDPGAEMGGALSARPRRDGGGRAFAGVLTAVLGAGALAVGGVLIGVNTTQRDADGFYDGEGAALSTTTRALVSYDPDVGTDGPAWLLNRLGDVRVTATGARDGPVFVGIGAREDVDAYLAGVAHEEAELDGSGGARTVSPGASAPAPPASRTFWARSSSGAGARTVVWPVEKGDWAAVVMNADGSAGIRTATRVSLRTDLVIWLGIGAVVAGIALAGTGTALLVSARRRPAPA